MFMSSISLDSSPGNAAAPDAASPASAAGTASPDGSGDFAQRLAQALSGRAEGQTLAAGGDALQALVMKQAAQASSAAQQIALALAPQGLQTLALGPGLEVVTSTESPDGDSLAKFAKAQGLDDEVVAWLFADPSQQLAQVPGLLPLTPLAPGATLPGATPAASPLTAVPAAPDLSALASPLDAGTALTPDNAALAQRAAELQAAQALLAGADKAAGAATAASWLQQQLSPGTEASAPGEQSPIEIRGLSMTTAPTLPAAPDAAQAPDADLAQRMQPQAATAIPTEVVSIEVDAEVLDAVDAKDRESQHPGGLHGGASHAHAAETSAADDAPVASTAAQRVDGYEELSQRLSETLAKRVLSQIERGQWQVRLLLKPARLGEVEVNLKMQGGELDASFMATNNVTRDLLNDGLPRLREVLSNAGMDIADLNVASGRSGAGGGNPTPRQPSGQAGANAPDPSASTATADPNAPAPAAARRVPSSAWDMLV